MDDDEQSGPKSDRLAKALTPAAEQSIIDRAVRAAVLEERHRLTAKDSVNPLDQALKSLQR
jgi:hypothetical protein